MILHALTQYYQRKAESDGGVAPEGFENKEIPFIIVIDKQGKFIQLEDTRELKNKKKVARTFLVPKGLGRSGSKSYEVSNLLWDHYGYVLAYAGEKGQYFHQPYLGCREFPCHFRLLEKAEDGLPREDITQDFGFMLYDMDFSKSDPRDSNNAEPMFYQCKAINGVITVPPADSEEVKR